MPTPRKNFSDRSLLIFKFHKTSRAFECAAIMFGKPSGWFAPAQIVCKFATLESSKWILACSDCATWTLAMWELEKIILGLGISKIKSRITVKSRNRKIEYFRLIIMYLYVLLLTLVHTKRQMTKNTAIIVSTLIFGTHFDENSQIYLLETYPTYHVQQKILRRGPFSAIVPWLTYFLVYRDYRRCHSIRQSVNMPC